MSEDRWLEGWYLELHGLSQWLPWAHLPSDTGNHQNHTEQPGKMAVALAPLWESSISWPLDVRNHPRPPTLNSQTPGRAEGHILSFRMEKVLQREYLWKNWLFQRQEILFGLIQKPSSHVALWARDSYTGLKAPKPHSHSCCFPSHLKSFTDSHHSLRYSQPCFTSAAPQLFTLSHSPASYNLTLSLQSHFTEAMELRALFISKSKIS